MVTSLLDFCCEDFDRDIAGHDGKRHDNRLKTKLQAAQNKQEPRNYLMRWLCQRLQWVRNPPQGSSLIRRNSRLSKIELVTEVGKDSGARRRVTAQQGHRLSNDDDEMRWSAIFRKWIGWFLEVRELDFLTGTKRGIVRWRVSTKTLFFSLTHGGGDQEGLQTNLS